VIVPYKLAGRQATLIPIAQLREKFPSTWDYLRRNQDYLAARENGRFAGADWHQFGRSQNIDLMLLPKILVPDITDRASFALDEAGAFAFTSGYGITLKENCGLTLKYVLGLANSTVLDFYWRQISTPLRGGFFRYFTQFIEQLPIPESTTVQRGVTESLVDCVIWLHQQPTVKEGERKHPQDPLMASFFEQWVNALAYELFFPQELHAADLHFFDLIQAEALPQLSNLAESDRLPRLRKLFQTTYASEHKLRQALYRLGSLDLVRTIEGKA
jgi:hypothetical protein